VADERCKICKRIDSMRLDLNDIEIAYIEGLAFGFNIRRDTTFMMLCQKHSDLLTEKLKEAGSKPVNFTSGGDT
jgi:hypothetical protein